MAKIATHRSGTGEKPYYFWEYLLFPFILRQTKTIRQQFNKGTRFFDIRVKKEELGIYRLHNKLISYKKTLSDVIDEIHELARTYEGQVYISITHEGELPSHITEEMYVQEIKNIADGYKILTLHDININGKEKRCLWENPASEVKIKRFYEKMDRNFWHYLIPFPIIWDTLKYRVKEFNNDEFVMVDFI